VSRLINYHPERVSVCAFFSGSYALPVPPGANRISTGGDIKQKFGYDIFAYMRFFVRPDAPTVIEKNVSFLHFNFRRKHSYSHLFTARLVHQSPLPRENPVVEGPPLR
jgi:hypothetical protein